MDKAKPGDPFLMTHREGVSAREISERIFFNGDDIFTIKNDGVVVGIIGYVELPKGIYSTWATFSDAVEDIPFSFTRFFVKLHKLMIQRYRPIRIQAFMAPGNEVDLKWAEVLGYAPEGVMRKGMITSEGYVDALLVSIIPGEI